MIKLPNPFPGVQVNVNAPQFVVQDNTPKKNKFKKAGTNGTLIAVILDASGSMASCFNQTIEGFNEFLNGQKNATGAGDAYITLIQFDAPKVITTYENLPIANAPKLSKENYMPNGGTNLFDAIGQTMESINKTLASKKKDERPGVLVLIMTDGHENASAKFDGESIKANIKLAEKQEWTFMFMGANVDAFAMGQTFGMNANNSFSYDVGATTSTYAAMSATTTAVRSAKMAGFSNDALYASSMIDPELQKTMKKDSK